MGKNRLKQWLGRSAEGIVIAGLGLLVFALLMGILYALFPSGTRLDMTLNSGKADTQDGLGGPGRKPLLSQGTQEAELNAAGQWSAMLTRVQRNVKSKSAAKLAWETAREGMTLNDQDAIQTLRQSSAQIRFDENNALDMGEHSLVVIRRMEKDLLQPEKRAFMVVVEGEIRGRMTGSDQTAAVLELATPGAVTRIPNPQQAGEQAEFKVRVNPDRSSTVTVFQGTAEVAAQGQKVLVGANQSTLVLPDEGPSAPRPLPRPPALEAPADAERFNYRGLPPRIAFAWEERPGVKRYHFVLARDADFKNIVTDESLARPALTHGGLKQGAFFWKVRVVDDFGESSFSPTRRFEVVQDQLPPKLEVSFPPETVSDPQVVLSGTAEPGAKVYVNGDPVPASAGGGFEHHLRLKQGINVILVEAVDALDNVAYCSQLVNCTF